ncbi:PREDICTED: F-box protein At5g07610-like [Fragaria vesca subsp. vesca]|uniref:F-box protein At5g07610-like n=1 Tax=Fragaria vesca subsp. vesca TaxID=101020 RepID=UPI0002C351AD|nr:PREDICTED: F-box protein At5g07610-like [Fragaria vesca subsp. vesca]
MIIQSCNGLFLCRPIKTSDTTLYVLNPTTKQFSRHAIPAAAATAAAAAAASSGQPCVLVGYALAFNPSKSPHYKLLFLQEGNHILNYHIHIYSSETRSWRLLSSCFVRLPLVNYDQAVYCNGAVHWVGLDNEISYYHIDDERVRNVFYPPPPPKKRESRMFRYFQESHCGSHLHLIDIYVSHLTRFEVLEMGRDYSGWSLKYHVELDPQLTGFPWLRWCQFTVLFLVPEEAGELSSSLLLHSPGKVISYNFKSNIFKSFELTSSHGVDDSTRRVYNRSHRYMATLACV